MGPILLLVVLSLCAVVMGAVWSFRAWGVVAGLAALAGLGCVTWFVPFGWIAGLVGGLALIPIAQKTLFRKIAERQSRLSIPSGTSEAPGSPAMVGQPGGSSGATPQPPLPAGSVRCERCGRPTPSATAALNDDGRPLCPACDMVNQADSGDRAALNGVRGTAFAAPALAFLSLFFNPLWALTIMAVAGGLGSFSYLQGNEDARRLLSASQRLVAQICGLMGAVAAIGIGVISLYLASRST